MNKTMKYKPLLLSFLTIITLMLVSCEKNKSIMEYVSGDDKDKIDLKGSMMKPDMKYDNIYAELVEKVVYVYFNETVENCAMTLTAKNGDVLFARRVSKQQPATLRIFMGDEPTGDYKLYITNGVDEASGWFHFENPSEINLSINNKTYQQ
ncbi:MAG: DUF3244 domain-containing protein [Bacteroidales bacterium]|nr:DUF3244 domain-containing protein [Bacteroidales bacterium]